MNWSDLNKTTRLRPSSVPRSSADLRSPYESDYDRVLFSSAFRRLQDKTQVFPLDRHDFVRTRLTHSMEVSTIGRDLGISVAKVLRNRDLDRSLMAEDAGTIVATACLLHDISGWRAPCRRVSSCTRSKAYAAFRDASGPARELARPVALAARHRHRLRRQDLDHAVTAGDQRIYHAPRSRSYRA